MICVLIMMSGFQSIREYPLNDRNSLVIGIPVLATIGTSMMPAALIQSMPTLISYLFGSAICVGALVAIIVNLCIPEEKVEEDDVVDDVMNETNAA
ncbi:MAG: hypothetical protein HGA49_12770 [Eubacteriaceae bacterium]|nr:hypothetical protein [Eubacteriaceae bacterium]